MVKKITGFHLDGQYILAVGDIEKFSLTDIVGLIFSMGKIENEYWDSSQCNNN